MSYISFVLRCAQENLEFYFKRLLFIALLTVCVCVQADRPAVAGNNIMDYAREKEKKLIQNRNPNSNDSIKNVKEKKKQKTGVLLTYEWTNIELLWGARSRVCVCYDVQLKFE